MHASGVTMSERFDDFRLLVSCDGPGVRLNVSGDIDLASAPALRDALQGVLDARTGDLDIEMAYTRFCESVGLRAVITVQQELQAADRAMRLVNPPPCVIRLLQLTATSDLFELASEAGPCGDL